MFNFVFIQNFFSFLLLGFGAVTIALNWYVFAINLTQRKGISYLPVIGAFSAGIGCANSPYTILNQFWWIPAVVDWGTLLCWIAFPFEYLFYSANETGLVEQSTNEPTETPGQQDVAHPQSPAEEKS